MENIIKKIGVLRSVVRDWSRWKLQEKLQYLHLKSRKEETFGSLDVDRVLNLFLVVAEIKAL